MVAVLRLKDWEPSQLLSEGRRMDRTFDFTVTSMSRVTNWCSKVPYKDQVQVLLIDIQPCSGFVGTSQIIVMS